MVRKEPPRDLELIEAFEKFSLYYDRKNKSLVVWDGKIQVAKSVEYFCHDLIQLSRMDEPDA